MTGINVFDLLAILKRQAWVLDFECFLEVSAPSGSCSKLWGAVLDDESILNDRGRVFKAIFPKSKHYSSQKTKQLLEQFHLLLDTFVHIRYANNKARGKLLFADLYAENELFASLDETMKAATGFLDESPNDHFAKAMVYDYLHYFGIGDDKEYLRQSDEHLELFCLEKRLKNVIDLLSQLRVDEKEIPVILEQKTKQLLQNIPTKATALILVLVKAVNFFMVPNKANYLAFKQCFFGLFEEMTSQRSYLLISLVNAVFILLNKKLNVRKEYLNLYRFGIENGLLIEQGVISSLRFDNIVHVAEVFQDFDLIDLAVEKLGPALNKKEGNASILLAKAYSSLGNKNYKETIITLEKLKRAKNVSFAFRLRKHVLTLKCVYEMTADKYDAFLMLEKKGASLRKLLNTYRKEGKITRSIEAQHLNFLLLICKIANIQNHGNTKKDFLGEMEELRGEIIEVEWLIEKIAATPIWTYIEEFKKLYDQTWNKYNVLVILQQKESAFRKILLRYYKKGFISKKDQEGCLNFFNLLCKICDERNPRNSKRHLLARFESYKGNIKEKSWLKKKIDKLRP